MPSVCSTCHASTSFRDQRSMRLVAMMPRKSPAMMLAGMMSTGFGWIGPRGFCAGRMTV